MRIPSPAALLTIAAAVGLVLLADVTAEALTEPLLADRQQSLLLGVMVVSGTAGLICRQVVVLFDLGRQVEASRRDHT